MKRYIDATDLAKQIADFKRAVNSPNSDYMTGYLSALSVTEGMIAGTPTADVVEVVRCKNCKWCEDLLMSGLYCNHPDNRNPINCFPTDFCNCGERREG